MNRPTAAVLVVPVLLAITCSIARSQEGQIQPATGGVESNAAARLQCFQIRFNMSVDYLAHGLLRSDLSTVPLPEGRVQFTLGERFDDIEYLDYLSFTAPAGHQDHTRDELRTFRVFISDELLDYLYGRYGLINPQGKTTLNMLILQASEIELVHRKLVATSPESFPHGTELYLGVELGADHLPKADASGNVIPNRPLEDYQLGRTILWPVNYSGHLRPYFNFYCPAVQEYIYQYATTLKQRDLASGSFIDDVLFGNELVTGPKGELLHYLGPGGVNEQFAALADAFMHVLKRIKTSYGRDPIYLNALRLPSPTSIYLSVSIFLDKYEQNPDAFDGLMNENYYWYDDRCADVAAYVSLAKRLDRINKKLLFVGSADPNNLLVFGDARKLLPHSVEDMSRTDSEMAKNIWLLNHLLAANNTFFYINFTYSIPMIRYDAYQLDFGESLGPPYQDGPVWHRKFQKGEIIFDTSRHRLSDIRYVMN